MRLSFVLLLAVAGAFPAHAACKDEVAAAFEKQRKSPAYRMEARLAGEDGETNMTIEYLPPDRMYQKVVTPATPAPQETIVVANTAWATMGGGWEELQPHLAQSAVAHMRQTLSEPPPPVGEFECLGTVSKDGKDYVGYRSVNPEPKPGEENLARTVFIDPITKLPVHNIVADGKAANAPIFSGVYSYPSDLKIESPFGDKP